MYYLLVIWVIYSLLVSLHHEGRHILGSLVYCYFPSAQNNGWHIGVSQDCPNFLREACPYMLPAKWAQQLSTLNFIFLIFSHLSPIVCLCC